MTGLDRLILNADLKCTCCGAPMGGCDCWSDRVDRCDREDGRGCVEHCPCPRCVSVRASGFVRVYIVTGTRHYAPAGACGAGDNTLCGRTIPASKWVTARPALDVRWDDCLRCAAKAAGMPLAPGSWAGVLTGEAT